MILKRYFGDKNFYKTALTVAIPIMVQNLITSFVSLLDNLMVGNLGTEQMSGVAIINQLMFIFNLTVFGALGGAGIFTAQFYGKNDEKGIRYTVRYKIIITAIIFILSILGFCLFDDELIGLFLHEGDTSSDIALTLDYGKQYLATVLWGLLPFCVTQILSSSLRETGETLAPMIAGFVAVFTNCAFNWVLIFGKLGFPMLGVVGAGIATDISRYVECLFIIVYTLKNRHRFSYFKGTFNSFKIPKKIFKDITRKGMPLLMNEVLWSTAMSLLSVAYSLYGISVVAGYSISSTVMNLANIAFIAMGSSIGIIVGKLLGANEFKKATDTVRKLATFSVLISVVIGVIVFFLAPIIPTAYKTTAISKEYATYFIRVSALFIPVHAFSNACYFTIRCGGKTVITFLMDSVYTMCMNVAIAFSLFYIFKSPIHTTFFIVQMCDVIKIIIGYILVKRKVWLNNIVTD